MEPADLVDWAWNIGMASVVLALLCGFAVALYKAMTEG